MTKNPEVILSENVNTMETVEMSYVEALRDALSSQMRKDDHVFVIGEEVGNYGGIFGVTQGLYEEFGPERMIDTPISESGFIGAAVGAAITGMRPVAEIMFTDFALVAMDQIVNQAAKIKYMFGGKAQVPLVIRIPTGTGRGAAAQHSQSLEAWFAHIPGLKVVMPSTPFDAKGLLNSAILDNNPIIFIEHKMLYKTTGQVPVEEYLIPIGKADVKREGSDVTIIATLMLLHTALDAAEKLAADGISAEVVDPRTIYPLDKATIIESVKKTNRAVVVHEASKTGGVGGEISAVIMEEAFDYLDAPVLRCAGIDVPIPFSPDLEKIVIPGEKEIIDAVKSLF
jgi:acetoin:2,6-dichlorophenolindophenol oxidoreductase subunit beta